MDFNSKKIIETQKKMNYTCELLHGAIAKDLFTTVELNLISGKTTLMTYGYF